MSRRQRAVQRESKDPRALRRLVDSCLRRDEAPPLKSLERLVASGFGVREDADRLLAAYEDRGLTRLAALSAVIEKDPRSSELIEALVEESCAAGWSPEDSEERWGWSLVRSQTRPEWWTAYPDEIALLGVRAVPGMVVILVKGESSEACTAARILGQLGFRAQSALPVLDDVAANGPRLVRRAARNAALAIRRAIKERGWQA